MTKLPKESDEKYNTKEASSLDKAVSELETDLAGVRDKSVAVNAA